MRFLWPTVQGLSENQTQLFIGLQAVIRRFADSAVPPLADVDIAEACRALASTFETADRGIIYEHQPTALQAQGLAAQLKTTLDGVAKNPNSSMQRQIAAVLRRIEEGARTADESLDDGSRSYLELLERLPQAPPPGESSPDAPADDLSEASPSPSRLIIP